MCGAIYWDMKPLRNSNPEESAKLTLAGPADTNRQQPFRCLQIS